MKHQNTNRSRVLLFIGMLCAFTLCTTSQQIKQEEEKPEDTEIADGKASEVSTLPQVKLVLPFDGFEPPLHQYIITSSFGIRDNVWGGPDEDFHKGVDLVTNEKGAKIYASQDGVVLTHYLPPGTVRGTKVFKGHPVYGALIIIAHENGVYTLYAHMSQTFVHEGQLVKKGDVIGIVGSSGQATGPHLHFEILFDPMQFCFNKKQAASERSYLN